MIEIEDAVDVFCGFEDAEANEVFLKETARLLTYQRTPLCMMEGSDNAPLFSNCCSPRKPGDKFFPYAALELQGCARLHSAPSVLPAES